ncbi:hypothetical protein ACFP3T_09890 [Lactiplantibacillus dongliensis]|uniref:SpoVT-AbrB domain-containing protein n=1 Tax=Lactiplantibacillus dongliensis TaxID=2559919 RepID=A0ABW1R740_9LACO|nr:hypothetical protein [Lactiplantibacillus dongliensis]
MKSVKARKVGSSTVLTVPKEIKALYTDYDVFAGTDGAIVYLPKLRIHLLMPSLLKLIGMPYPTKIF